MDVLKNMFIFFNSRSYMLDILEEEDIKLEDMAELVLGVSHMINYKIHILLFEIYIYIYNPHSSSTGRMWHKVNF